MSKKILLVRHGRTEEKSQGQRDQDRSLTTEGMQNSSLMGDYLSNQGIDPELIITSDALRAQQTANLIAEQLKYPIQKIHINTNIYEGSVRVMMTLINQLEDRYSSVMMVGHNPSMLYLAEYLSKAEIESLTTCGIIIIDFKIKSWKRVQEGSGSFADYIYPDLVNSINRE